MHNIWLAETASTTAKLSLKPNTHRRRNADATQLSSWVSSAVWIRDWLARVSTSLTKFANSEVELVGAVNAHDGSRDPVYNFLCCWAIELDGKWRH